MWYLPAPAEVQPSTGAVWQELTEGLQSVDSTIKVFSPVKRFPFLRLSLWYMSAMCSPQMGNSVSFGEMEMIPFSCCTPTKSFDFTGHSSTPAKLCSISKGQATRSLG